MKKISIDLELQKAFKKAYNKGVKMCHEVIYAEVGDVNETAQRALRIIKKLLMK